MSAKAYVINFKLYIYVQVKGSSRYSDCQGLLNDVNDETAAMKRFMPLQLSVAHSFLYFDFRCEHCAKIRHFPLFVHNSSCFICNRNAKKFHNRISRLRKGMWPI